jgi:chromosome segregation ATPase
LNHQEKTLIEDNQRLKQEYRARSAHLERLRQTLADVKDRYELLLAERERRESALRNRLDAVKAIRDARVAAIEKIRAEQGELNKEIEGLETIAEDLTDKKDRINEEITNLEEEARHRQRQLRSFAEIARPAGSD